AREIAATVAVVFSPVKAVFRTHEGVRILAELVADTRIVSQEILQSGVVFEKLLIVNELRILANLLGNFTMVVQEFIEIAQLRAARIIFLRTPHVIILIRILGRSGLCISGGANTEKRSEC